LKAVFEGLRREVITCMAKKKKKAKKIKGKRKGGKKVRSAKSGRYVSKKYGKKHKATTVEEEV